jgi:hypothetical protein
MPTVPVVPAKFLLRRDTSANWTSTDPVLQDGEPGYETDTGKMKIGKYATGSTTTLLSWTALPYIGAMSLSTPPSGLRITSYNFEQDISIVISLGGQLIPTPYTVQVFNGTDIIYNGYNIQPDTGLTTYTLTLTNPNYFKTDETYSIEFRDNNGALLTWANVVYTPPNNFPNTLTVVPPRLDPLPPPEAELALGETDDRARPYVVSYKTIGIDYTYSGPAIDVKFVVYSAPNTIFYESNTVSIPRSETDIPLTYNITVGTFYPSNSNYKIGIYKLNDTQIWSYESFYFLSLSILSFNIISNNSFTVEFNNPLYGVVEDVSLLSKINTASPSIIWSNGSSIGFSSPGILPPGITFSTDLTTSYIFVITFRDNSSVRLERTYRTAISDDATCIIDTVNSVSVSLKLTNLDSFYVQTTVGAITYRTSNQSVSSSSQGFNYVDVSTRSFYGSGLTFSPPITFLYDQLYTFKIISNSDSSIFKNISGVSLGNLVGLLTNPSNTEDITNYELITASVPSIVNSATTTNALDIVLPVNWRGASVNPTIRLLNNSGASINLVSSTITLSYTNAFVFKTLRVTTGPGVVLANQNYKLQIEFSSGNYLDTQPVLYSNPNLQIVQFEGFTGVRVIQKLSGASQLVNIYICDSDGNAAVHVGYATINNTGNTPTFVRFSRSGSNVIQSYVHGIRYILGVDNVGSPPATIYSNTFIPTYSESTTTLSSISNIGNAISTSWSSNSPFASDYRIFLTLKVNNTSESYDALTLNSSTGALETDGTVDSGLILSPIVASSTPTSKANITGAILPMSYTSIVSGFTGTVSGTLASPNVFTYIVTGAAGTLTTMFGPTPSSSLQITGLPNIFNRIIARENIAITTYTAGGTTATFTTTVTGLSASPIATVSGGTILITASSGFLNQTSVEIDSALRSDAVNGIYVFNTKGLHSFNVGQYVTISGLSQQALNMSGVIYRVPYLSSPADDGFGNKVRDNTVFYIKKSGVSFVANALAPQVGATATLTLNPNAYYYISATQYGSNYYYSTGIPRLKFTTYTIQRTGTGPIAGLDTFRIFIDSLANNTLINSSNQNREFTINGCSETLLNGINFIGTPNSITSITFGGFFFYHVGAPITGANIVTAEASCFPVLINKEVDHSQVLRYTRASVQSVSVNFTTRTDSLVTVIREFQLAPYTVGIQQKTGSSYSLISNAVAVRDTSTTSIATDVALLTGTVFNIGSTYRAVVTLSPASGGTFDYYGSDIIYDYDRTVLNSDTAEVSFTPFSSTSNPNSISNRIFVSFPYKGPPALAWFKLFNSNDNLRVNPYNATSFITLPSAPTQTTVTRTLNIDDNLVPQQFYTGAIYFNLTDSPANSIFFNAVNTFQYTPSTCAITVINITTNTVTLKFDWSGYPLQRDARITLQLPKTPPAEGYEPAPITFANSAVNFSGSSPGFYTSQTFTLSGSSTFNTDPGVIYRLLVDNLPDSTVTPSVMFAASNLSVSIQNTGSSMFSDIGLNLGVLTFTGLCYALSDVHITFTLYSYTYAAPTSATGATPLVIGDLNVAASASGVSFGQITVPSIKLLFDTFYNVFYTATIEGGTLVTGYIRPNAELYDPAGYDILVFAGQSNMVGYDWVGVSGDAQAGTSNYTYPPQAGLPLRVIPFETSTPPRLILGGDNSEKENLVDPNGKSVKIMTESGGTYSIVTAKGPFISSESSEPVKEDKNPINIAYQFTKYYLNHEPSLVNPKRRVCIVFRPKGGSSFQALDQWTAGLSPSSGSTISFTNKLVQAINNVQTKKPNPEDSTYTCNRIRVMGWLQGESDGPDNGDIWANNYMGPMIKTIFENTNTPPTNAYFILGNIFYHYNALYRDWGSTGNADIRRLPDAMTKTVQLIKDIDTFPVVSSSRTDVSRPSGTRAFYAKSVSSHGLHSMDDNVPTDVILISGMVTIHYNARSLRIFGRRFFNAYLDLIDKGNERYGEPTSLKGPSTLWYDTFKRTLNWYSTATSYDYRKNPVGYLLSATLTSFPDVNDDGIDTAATYYAIFSEYASGSGYTYVPHSPAQRDTTITPPADKFGIKPTNTVAELVVSGVNLTGLRYYGAAKTYVPISPGNVNITNIRAVAVAGGTSITYTIGTHPLRVGSLITATLPSPNAQYSITTSTSVTGITSNSVTVFIASNLTAATITSPGGTVSYKDTIDITLDRKVLSAPLATFIEDLDTNWPSWNGSSSIVFNIEPVWYNSATSSHILGRSNISLSSPFFGTNWNTLGNVVNTASMSSTIVYLPVPNISALWTIYNQNFVLHNQIYTGVSGSPTGRVIIGCGIVPNGTYGTIPTRNINITSTSTQTLYSVIGINRINPNGAGTGMSAVLPSGLTFNEAYPANISTDVYPDALSPWDPGSFTGTLGWSSGNEPNGTYGRGCLINLLATANVDTILFFSQARTILTSGYEPDSYMAGFVDTGGGGNRSASPTQACQFAAIAEPGSCLDPVIQATATNANTQAVPLHIALNVPSTSNLYYFSLVNTGTAISLRMRNVLPNTNYTVNYWFSVMANRVPFDITAITGAKWSAPRRPNAAYGGTGISPYINTVTNPLPIRLVTEQVIANRKIFIVGTAGTEVLITSNYSTIAINNKIYLTNVGSLSAYLSINTMYYLVSVNQTALNGNTLPFNMFRVTLSTIPGGSPITLPTNVRGLSLDGKIITGGTYPASITGFSGTTINLTSTTTLTSDSKFYLRTSLGGKPVGYYFLRNPTLVSGTSYTANISATSGGDSITLTGATSTATIDVLVSTYLFTQGAEYFRPNYPSVGNDSTIGQNIYFDTVSRSSSRNITNTSMYPTSWDGRWTKMSFSFTTPSYKYTDAFSSAYLNIGPLPSVRSFAPKTATLSTLSNINASVANQITFTTTSAHGLSVNDIINSITFTGTGAGYKYFEFNTPKRITAVTSNSPFTFRLINDYAIPPTGLFPSSVVLTGSGPTITYRRNDYSVYEREYIDSSFNFAGFDLQVGTDRI